MQVSEIWIMLQEFTESFVEAINETIMLCTTIMREPRGLASGTLVALVSSFIVKLEDNKSKLQELKTEVILVLTK